MEARGETRIRDGRSWRIGGEGDVAWINDATVETVAITHAIPPVFGAYWTLDVPYAGVGEWSPEEVRRFPLDVLDLLTADTAPQPWWLGLLQRWVDSEIAFPHRSCASRDRRRRSTSTRPCLTSEPHWGRRWPCSVLSRGRPLPVPAKKDLVVAVDDARELKSASSVRWTVFSFEPDGLAELREPAGCCGDVGDVDDGVDGEHAQGRASRRGTTVVFRAPTILPLGRRRRAHARAGALASWRSREVD